MTKLKRPVKRTDAGFIREAGQIRPIVVVLRPPNIIGFRAKGCRKEYQLTTGVCYAMAVKAHVAYEKKQKAHERRERKHGKTKGHKTR